jgi:hypothetical protein
MLPKRQFDAPQTKIWEGGTKDEMRIFEALFKGVSNQFGPRSIEKCFENPHFVFCSSFPNLRLGSGKIAPFGGGVDARSMTYMALELYAPQTKILEGRTDLSECVFESTFQRFVAQIMYSHP